MTQPPQKLSYSHEAMIDQILANPSLTHKELSEIFGYTPVWIGCVIASDAFQTKLAARRAELVDPMIRARIEAGFNRMVERSSEILMEKLSKPSHQVTDQLALRALEIASKASGYGARDTKPAEQAPVNVNIHLNELKTNLTRMLHARDDDGEIIDVPAKEP